MKLCSPEPRQQTSQAEASFNRLLEAIGHVLAKVPAAEKPEVQFTLSLAGERSQFIRFNQAKVRQTGQVCDGQLRLTLMGYESTTSATLPFAGDFEVDWAVTQPLLKLLQAELPQLPVDPYRVSPIEQVALSPTGKPGQSREVRSEQRLDQLMGPLMASERLIKTVLSPVTQLDFSGFYAGGWAYRAYGDSAGTRHWFETPSFTLDYSLFGDRTGQAVKGTLAGRQWNEAEYHRVIATGKQQLALLARPVKALPRGAYRTYLAPAAVADVIETLAWGGGLGEADLRRGNSAFNQLEAGEAQLSEQFSLVEDFQRIDVPQFNGEGQFAPQQLPVIDKGRWASSLVSARSAKEYGKSGNGANAGESLRAPTVAPGQLPADGVLAALGTGLYVSNLHYLNWSDLTAGRMTGMTRYACFWVEDGEVVAPIENLRFDDDLYHFLGEGLVGLSDRQTFVPAVGTYDRRSLGGMWVPGMLIDPFRYTL